MKGWDEEKGFFTLRHVSMDAVNSKSMLRENCHLISRKSKTVEMMRGEKKAQQRK